MAHCSCWSCFEVVWIHTDDKYFALVEGQAHVNFSKLDAQMKAVLNSLPDLSIPNQQVIDTDGNALLVDGTSKQWDHISDSSARQKVRDSHRKKNDEVVDQVTSDKTDVSPVKDDLGRSYATGKRKNAVARVWIKVGSGKIVINGKDIDKYFLRPVLNMLVNQPLELTNKKRPKLL